MKHRTITGAIAYTSRKPERMHEARGREAFTITRHADGAVTIRAHCEIEDPEPTVLRDVIYALDAVPGIDLARLPAGTVLVGESGIKTAADVRLLGAAGAHAVLVGETLMRAESPGAALSELLEDTV